MTKLYMAATITFLTTMTLSSCDCGASAPPGGDQVDSGLAGADASGDGGVIDFDAAGGDATMGDDAAAGTDAATGTDASAGTDAAAGPDAAAGTDATVSNDATAGADAATGTDAALPDSSVVANQPPVVTITAPPGDSYFLSGVSIDFVGAASDPEDGALSGAALVWSSDIDGQLGLGENITSALATLGVHTITLTATDSQSASGQASITINVVDNLPPVCTINDPDDGDTFMEGDTIDFDGDCTDPEGNNIPNGDLTWSSDVDGQLGLGQQVQTALASTGAHVITLCAPDPDDAQLEGCTSITITNQANTAPSCSIMAPADGSGVPADSPAFFQGSASDVEDPDLTGQDLQYLWSSDVTGDMGSNLNDIESFGPGNAGQHIITFTVTDSGGLECFDTITITVSRAPSATIESYSQGGDPNDPFADDAPIDFTGSATDPDGDAFTLTWTDSLSGEFATGTTANLPAPEVGRHTVVLTATDNNGVSGTDTVSFDVLAAGQTSLLEPFTDVNSEMVNQGDPVAEALLAVSGDVVYVANGNQALFSFDGTDPAATATVLDGNNFPADDVQDMWLDQTNGLIYLATADGFMVCDWSTGGGIDTQSCTTYRGGDIPDGDDDITAVVRLEGSDGLDYTVVANPMGIMVLDDPDGANTGDTYLWDHDVNAMGVDGDMVWIATDNEGLVLFDPVTGDSTTYHDGNSPLPDNQVRSVAVGSDGVIWIGTDAGLASFDPATDAWEVWTTFSPPAPGLINNTVRSLAIHTVDIGGEVRDVIWIGTSNGVSRFDPTIPSFTDFTTADGLPHNRVNDIVVLSDGTKIFGTELGVVSYIGL